MAEENNQAAGQSKDDAQEKNVERGGTEVENKEKATAGEAAAVEAELRVKIEKELEKSMNEFESRISGRMEKVQAETKAQVEKLEERAKEAENRANEEQKRANEAQKRADEAETKLEEAETKLKAAEAKTKEPKDKAGQEEKTVPQQPDQPNQVYTPQNLNTTVTLNGLPNTTRKAVETHPNGFSTINMGAFKSGDSGEITVDQGRGQDTFKFQNGLLTDVTFHPDSTYIGKAEMMATAVKNGNKTISSEHILGAFKKDEAARGTQGYAGNDLGEKVENFIKVNNIEGELAEALKNGAQSGQQQQNQERARMTAQAAPSPMPTRAAPPNPNQPQQNPVHQPPSSPTTVNAHDQSSGAVPAPPPPTANHVVNKKSQSITNNISQRGAPPLLNQDSTFAKGAEATRVVGSGPISASVVKTTVPKKTESLGQEK